MPRWPGCRRDGRRSVWAARPLSGDSARPRMRRLVHVEQARRCRPRCSAASSTGWRGPVIPGLRADRRRRPSRCVAKLWRSACGVAVSGRPSARRRVSIWRCTMRGLSGPPRAPTNRRPVRRQRIRAGGEVFRHGLPHRRQHRHEALLAALAGDRDLLAERRRGARQPKRLRDAQPASVKQRQHGNVALGLPRARGDAGGRLDDVPAASSPTAASGRSRQFRARAAPRVPGSTRDRDVREIG